MDNDSQKLIKLINEFSQINYIHLASKIKEYKTLMEYTPKNSQDSMLYLDAIRKRDAALSAQSKLIKDMCSGLGDELFKALEKVTSLERSQIADTEIARKESMTEQMEDLLKEYE